MPVPTATIGTDTANAQRMSNVMNRQNNPDYVFTGNINLAHKPEFFVRIFNVSDMEHRIERPWVNYNPAQRAKMIIIPACEAGQKHSKPFVINDIVQVPIRHVTSGEMDARGVDGKFLAQDALNPDDPSGSWKTVKPIGAGQSTNEGTNLYHWGCFWERTKTDDLTEEPSMEAVEMAVRRMEANYNRLIDEAKTFWMGGDQMRLQIGNTHRRAASYYGLEFEWNQVYKATMDCPGCGSRVPQTAAICPKCPSTFNWERALSLGLRTVDQAIAAGVMEPQAVEMATPKKARKRA
jgi:hypothetical protein